MPEPRPNTLIDMRSDTVSLPTAAMRAAMAAAELGDDGRDGDPTTRRLEEHAAALLGKEAAVFVSSGTQGNLVSLLAHTDRTAAGVLLEADCHILRTEAGGIATIAGLLPLAVPGRKGQMPLEALAAAIQPKHAGGALRTGLICLETTHNGAGGVPLPLEHMAAVKALADRHGLPVHLDGARIFNAAVALGVPAAGIARHVDSVTFCLSKGLSAPVGSIIAGPAAFIARARHYRRMVGGAMRQNGMLAAAGLVALDQQIDRLAEDHARAHRLAAAIHALDARLCDPADCPTNIVRVAVERTGLSSAAWSELMREEGVLVAPYAGRGLRFVAHCEIDDTALEAVIAAFGRAWQRAATAAPRAAAAAG